MTKRERVSAVLRGGAPDRPPLFDLLRNDAVLAHYSGLDPFRDPEAAVYAAARNVLDSTRSLRLPDPEGEERGQDGRVIVRRRWTTWNERIHPPTLEEARSDLRQRVEDLERRMDDEDAARADAARLREDASQKLSRLGDDFAYVTPAFGVGVMIYHAYGLETFSYLLADDEDLVLRYLALNAERSARRIARLDLTDLAVAVFVGEDIAYKGTTLFSPAFLRRAFMPHLERLVALYHERGLPVMFHSDGSLMGVLDDLMACGIDLLNPIEVLAGMDVKEIRRRCPRLILAGGIDVSQLLPLGAPQEVAAATKSLIQTAGPGVLVGSSTELNDAVPLDNYRALVEAVMAYRY
ncbi:MAG: hypothetical protein A3F84_14045 [Candidatus Handelsmanbacteria bacterium RIFCSPLOWO2_12_FULL_64_10]|uniref:Uroporphyrinogen decarboxylase (URO-D) domain-containing protein n=1 Tax=Handelsmanbacteria sp. (strain RIFCSPLOWO2_12_FULL_64_10) TaxID=1817868 RepID=A0A1F6CD55_HANXR|nr:MAG: hypothetical protein A3F84_14045 [Candidatus Handelsmanbacteria bacterium RIFCSPLOWO2_12_FULL_64_10]